MKTRTDLPAYSIDGWNEVFDEVTLSGLPLIFVNTILITFKNGTYWEVEIPTKYKNKSSNDFDEVLNEFCSEQLDYICDVDIQIDTKKVRKAVEKAVKKTLTKIKLI